MKKEDCFKVRSVKDCFRKNLTPNKGRIITKRRKPSEHEMKIAKLLLRKFGGTINFLAGKGEMGLKTPDANWSGRLLEIKRAKGKSSADSQTRKALEQIKGNGVILLDISENTKSVIQIKQEIIHRIKRETSHKNKKDLNLNIIIIKNRRVIDILEITKKGGSLVLAQRGQVASTSILNIIPKLRCNI